MNWGIFALCVSAALIVAWLWLLSKGRWAWPGLIASFGCLVAASFNAAAPFRGVIDPNYVGFGFGLLRAEKGIMVTALAGSILLFCGISAMIAASRRSGPALWVVAGTCAAMFVIIGVPTIQASLSEPAGNAIQFGEYLTIPGAAATVLMLILFAVPFAVGMVWAPRAAMKRT